MPFIAQGGVATVTIPATQSIVIGAFRGGTAQMTLPFGQPSGPIAIVIDGSTTFGPYPGGTTASITAISSDCEYVIGASPVLTDAPFNRATVAITGGTIENTAIGATSPTSGSFTSLRSAGTSGLLIALTDSSGTPGNVTNNTAHGRAAFAAAGTSVVVTNSLVAATSTVFVQLGGTDATLKSVTVTCGAGSFTVTGNTAATAITPFDFLVVRT